MRRPLSLILFLSYVEASAECNQLKPEGSGVAVIIVKCMKHSAQNPGFGLNLGFRLNLGLEKLNPVAV